MGIQLVTQWCHESQDSDHSWSTHDRWLLFKLHSLDCCEFIVQLVANEIHNKSNQWSLSSDYIFPKCAVFSRLSLEAYVVSRHHWSTDYNAFWEASGAR